MKAPLYILLGLVVSGCVTKTGQPAPAVETRGVTAPKPEGLVDCKMEKPTGSNLPIKVCRRPLTDAEKQKTQRDVRDMKRQTTP